MENRRCANCGLLNSVSAETCIGCGAELGSSAWNKFPDAQSNAQAYENEKGSGTASEEPELSTHIGPFKSIGAVITPTIDLFKDNIWLITKIVFFVFAPYEVFKVMEIRSGRLNWQTGVGIVALDLACRALVAPALIYALVTVMRTRTAPSVTEAYRWTLGRLGRIMVCALLAWVVEILGFICLVIPGIILGLAFTVVYPMAALEHGSPVKILKRSYELTYGYKGKIFLAGIVVGLLTWVITIPVSVLAAFMEASLNFWPLNIATALLVDVAYQLSTVLSLVIYLSLALHDPNNLRDEGNAAMNAL